MLNLVWLSKQANQKVLFKNFDPARQTWVVSDRKTEFFLMRTLLERTDIVNEPIKRARDLWQKMLENIDTEIKVLELLGSKIQARDFLLTEGTSEWCKRPRAPQKLLDACEALAPLITHADAQEILDNYSEEFKHSAGPFLEMARLGVIFYRRCIENRRLPRFFVPFYLSEKDILPHDKDFIFDLGFDLRDGERELIQRLSQKNEVTVLIPAASAEKLSESGLFAYRNFEVGLARVSSKTINSDARKGAPDEIEIWRCSSPEAEARKAVEIISKWVSEGISPEKICVTAPDISIYENILSHDLDWEGIGLQRTLKTRLSASRLFRALDARLQIMNGIMRASVLEEAFLTASGYKGSLRRRAERRVLRPVMLEHQVPHEEIKKQVSQLRSKKTSKRLGLHEFEDVVIEFFGDLVKVASQYENALEAEQRNGLFLLALKKMRVEVGQVKLELPLWIEAWQEITNNFRMNYKQAVEGGVWAVDLSSAEETPAENIIILGGIEESNRNSIIGTLGEAKTKFFSELGFDFSGSTKKKSDPMINWIMTGERKNLVLSCPKTDSRGRSVAASPLWLKISNARGRDLEKLDFARHTKWIDVQKTILKDSTSTAVDVYKKWPEGTSQKIGLLVTEELAGTRKIIIPEMEAHPLPITLSASRIESYWECPFKFFTTAFLGLYDEADLEVEPSPQARGQWMHAAAEKIMSSEKELQSWDDKALSDLVDSLDEIQKKVSSDVWPSIRSRFVRQLKRFISFEIEWRKTYPRARPAGLEAKIIGTIGWSKESPEIHFAVGKPIKAGDFWSEFRGSIDRVDMTAQGQAIIVDYKSSAAATSNIASWSKKGNFQLALYSEAVEAGLLDQKPHQIIAAQYYVLRNPEREKGFRLIDEDLSGILPSGGGKSAVDSQEKNQFFGEIDIMVHEVLEKIRLGDMSPKPENESLCITCSWRTSCRAAHLS